MSRRKMGFKILMLVAFWPTFPVVVLFLSGHWEDFLQESLIPHWWIFVLVDLIGVMVALYFMTKKGEFSYQVTTEAAKCDYPDSAELSYNISLKEIDKILRITRAQHGHNDYYIVDKRGERFLIPQVYMLHVGKVIKAIQKAEPRIEEISNKK